MREKRIDEEPLFTRMRGKAVELGVDLEVAEALSEVAVRWHLTAKARAIKMKHDRLSMLANRYKCKNANCKMPKIIHDELADSGD